MKTSQEQGTNRVNLISLKRLTHQIDRQIGYYVSYSQIEIEKNGWGGGNLKKGLVTNKKRYRKFW